MVQNLFSGNEQGVGSAVITCTISGSSICCGGELRLAERSP